ncbi:olfactory receptor 51E1-like [Pseudophryne corroboree]|uniref:olfactory receptor 51E1-like n=1 Tax=Pseudophryne corroboree TaxID=495146 RepID=UPI0030821A9E
MPLSNCSNSSDFILSGIPASAEFHFWIGFLLFFIYLVAVIGNLTLLYIIKVDQELHEPMYIFLFMLSVVDLAVATTSMPRMLGIFWFDSRQITFGMCLTQMFFVHFLSALESGILVAMAVDRYVAICLPLRYSSILTYENILKISLVIAVRGAAVMIPLPLLIKRLSLWKDNLLTHSYCLHQEVMNLACGDIRVNVIYGLFIILSVMGVDCLFISGSYLLLIKTVVSVAADANLKAFSTCAAHICAVLVYYVPLIGLSVVHRFNITVVPNLHILFGNVYLLLPPVINPLIYGIKTKQIRSRLSKLFSKTTKQGTIPRELCNICAEHDK